MLRWRCGHSGSVGSLSNFLKLSARPHLWSSGLTSTASCGCASPCWVYKHQPLQQRLGPAVPIHEQPLVHFYSHNRLTLLQPQPPHTSTATTASHFYSHNRLTLLGVNSQAMLVTVGHNAIDQVLQLFRVAGTQCDDTSSAYSMSVTSSCSSSATPCSLTPAPLASVTRCWCRSQMYRLNTLCSEGIPQVGAGPRCTD